ncbi:MAG: hypothetical protein AAF750_12530 [Planctomycetota bacterium]
MNILTKAFVVLVTVLSILLVALVVPFVHQQTTTEAELADLQSQLSVARAEANANAKELAEKLDVEDAQLLQLQTSQTDRDNEVIRVTGELNRISDEKNTLEQDLAKAEANNQVLTRVFDAQAGRIKTLSDNLLTAQKTQIEQNTQIAELTATNAKKEQDLAVLRLQVQKLQEDQTATLAAKQAVEAKLASALALVGDNASASALPPVAPDIRGQVTRVQSPLDNLTLVEINVGKRDGVAADMVFRVHRGDNFLGELTILTVERGLAVGQLSLVQGDVKPGDSISAGSGI